MILGSAYTLVVPYPTAAPGFGSQPAKLVWPDKSSVGVLAFGLDLKNWLANIEDTLIGAPMFSFYPSGDPYDAAASTGVIFGTAVAATFAAGIPGTEYQVDIKVNTSGGSTENFSAILPINYDSPSTLPPNPIPPPTGSNLVPVAYGLVSTGNTLAGALALPAVINIFTGVPLVGGLNSGCRLPLINPGVPIIVINTVVNGNALYVYPPDTLSTINGAGQAVPVQIPAPIALGTATESTFVYNNTESPFSITAF